MNLGDDEPWLLEILRGCTQDMLDDLERRSSQLGTAAPSSLAERIAELTDELAALPGPG